MSRCAWADVASSRVGATALYVTAAASFAGCGVYDYELAASDDSGVNDGRGGAQSGATSSSRGGTPSAGGHVNGGSGGAGTAGAVPVAGIGGAGTSGTAGLTGWASVSECGPRGTIGGEDGPSVRPKSAAELDDALRAEGPSVIEISGTIELGERVVFVSSDKTLLGVGGAELIGSVRVRDARNVILQNVRFNGGGVPGDRDALELDASTCVWIDHCEFLDGPDSNLDIVRGSDLVTVSWSKFYYVVKDDDHRLGSVCGNSDADTPGRINVTFHHNHWGERLGREMPGVRHGKVHLFNNYFSSAGNEYCIAARYLSKLLVEHNVFEGVNDPIVFEQDADTAEVVETGNVYSATSGSAVSRGAAFVPPYAYAIESAEAARARVVAEAGVR